MIKMATEQSVTQAITKAASEAMNTAILAVRGRRSDQNQKSSACSTKIKWTTIEMANLQLEGSI